MFRNLVNLVRKNMPVDPDNLVMYAIFYKNKAISSPACNENAVHYQMQYFVITDIGNNHLPWDYIIENQIYMEKVASGRLFQYDFIRGETIPIYLTDNLWTCSCQFGKYIHHKNLFCDKCKSHSPWINNYSFTYKRMAFLHLKKQKYPYWSKIIKKLSIQLQNKSAHGAIV